MKNLYILFISVLLILSCQNKKDSKKELTSTDTLMVTTEPKGDSNEELTVIDTEDAIRWLTEVIESHLNEGGYPMEDICTPAYYEYKLDAVQVGYDGGLTETEFNKKWSNKYNVKYAGLGTGFLISAQDWNKIKVTSCIPKSDEDTRSLLLKVTMVDIELNDSFQRDIKIVPVGKAYLIDDVVEYN